MIGSTLDLIEISWVLLIIGVTASIAWLIAPYITKIYTHESSLIDRVFDPIENLIYRIIGIDKNRGMDWKEYFLTGLFVNLIMMALTFSIFLFQGVLPLNPQHFSSLNWNLALNNVISFMTNTDLQHYAGESTLSYLSQTAAVQFLMFSAPATGISMAVAMIRGFRVGAKDLGNFYLDFTRTIIRLLLPLSILVSLVLVVLGVPQSISGYAVVRTIEGVTQQIAIGPIASLTSITQLGSNGGGYFGANFAYPFQNPSPVSDILELSLMLLLPTALIFVFGRLLGKKSESKPVFIAAYSMLGINLLIGFLQKVSLGPGIETRIGGFFSTFWTIISTSTNTGSLNASLYAMSPSAVLSSFMSMFIQSTPGAVGTGLIYMIMYVILTVFIVGLMAGRTPEYLGIKITARDVGLIMLAFIIHPIIILIPTILAYTTGAAAQIGIGANAIGFTKIFYEFSSAAANNGSDFFGVLANTPFFNVATAIVMFVGRYAPMCILLALSGSVLGRKREAVSGLRTDSLVFAVVLVGSIIILVLLVFLPFLALGPILAFFEGRMNFFG